MSENEKSRSKEYSSAREVFDDLGIEEKAFFLLESTVKTIVDGLQKAGDEVSTAMKEACDKAEEAASSDTDGSDEKAEKKKTATKKAASKRASSKKTTSKKSSPRKTATKKKPSKES